MRSPISLVELIVEAINKLAEAEPPKDRILGMFADEPEVVDEILEEIMSDRAEAHLMPSLSSP